MLQKAAPSSNPLSVFRWNSNPNFSFKFVNFFLYLRTIILAIAVLSGCSKRETVSEKSQVPQTAHETNIVTLTAKNLEYAGIKTEQAKLGRLETTLKVAGRVTENMNKTAKIASTLEGRLIKLGFDINDPVRTGDVLALVQAPELFGKPLELKAPIDGVIIQRNSTVGELVNKGSNIYIISDPADLWVIAEVKERDVAAVKVGQDVEFEVLAYPGEKFRGKVVRLGNQIEANSRTLEARIETGNADGRLKPGMFADVGITTTITKDVVVIPDAALQSNGDNRIVFVALGANKFEQRIVKLGMEQRGYAEVLGGVKIGEQVVTEGSFILKSELLKSELGEE